MVEHEGVEWPNPLDGAVYEVFGCRWIGEVGLGVGQAIAFATQGREHSLDPARIGAPRLAHIVGGIGMGEDARSLVPQQARRDGKADPLPTAHARDQRGARHMPTMP